MMPRCKEEKIQISIEIPVFMYITRLSYDKFVGLYHFHTYMDLHQVLRLARNPDPGEYIVEHRSR